MLLRLLAALSILTAVWAPSAVLAQTEATASAAPQHVLVPAPDGRSVDLNVWTAADERGVVVFSHGFGGTPAAYDRLIAAWVAHGFSVVAPLHVDSQEHPQRSAEGFVAFSTRVADLAATRDYVRARHPGKPIIAAGHSFGSLLSLIEGGAVTAAGAFGDPQVEGVIAFSTAGNIPGLITPTSYAALNTPLLLITGDRDLVPGYADDWHDHRTAFDQSPAGDKTLMIFAGGDHSLVDNADAADFALIVQATEAFLDAYALGDAAARARLAGLAAPDGVVIERR